MHDWPNELSRGEKQRLSVARLLLKRPSLAILDEATSALDVSMCEKIYRQFQKDRITVITIAHYMEHLRKFHSVLWKFQVDTNSISSNAIVVSY